MLYLYSPWRIGGRDGELYTDCVDNACHLIIISENHLLLISY